MTTTTLYGQAAQTVDGTGAGNAGTIGLHFTVSSACTLDGMWLYSPSGHSLTQLPATIALYTTQSSPSTGTLVTSNAATWLTGPGGSSASAGSGWVFAAFTSPPSLSSGTEYMVAAFRNDAVNGWFALLSTATWPKSAGILTAPKDTGNGQGWYDNVDTSLHFPSSQLAGYNWYLDPQVTTGASSSRTGSLTVTPSFAAAANRTRNRSASLTVTPSLTASGPAVHGASASLTVAPLLSASAARTRNRSASLAVTPSLSAGRAPVRNRAASLTVTLSLTAARQASHVRAALLAVSPAFSAARAASRSRTAPLAVTPILAAAATRVAGAPPAYPDAPVAGKVELYLGGTWTDITGAALPDGQQHGSITSGQPDGAQQPNPAAMTRIWDNPDYSLSPRNAAGPWYGQLRQNTPARVSVGSCYGGYLRLEAGASDRAYVNDTAALHVTGSLELRIEARLSDYRGCVIAARYDNTQPSWYWLLNRDGTLTFAWYDSGGTPHSVTSDASPAVSWKAFRVVLDAASGTVTFYVSDGIDGSWTQVGSVLSGTGGATTTVRAGNAPLVVGWSNNLSPAQMLGQVSGFRMYSGIGGTKVADAAFSVQVPGITSWTDLAGLTWQLAGGAELTARDYRLHGELASLQPAAHVSGALPRVQAAIAGRMRRLQQGSAPVADSAMKRAVLSQGGDLYPVDYWTMEDGPVAKVFGAASGRQMLTAQLGTVQAAADASFEASAPLPQLNGDMLSFAVDSYSGATAWAVRFLFGEGQTLPASGSARLLELRTTGACTLVTVSVNHDGTLNFVGKLSGGATAFSFTEIAYPQVSGWWSVEATASGGGVLYALVAIAPGAVTGSSESQLVTGHGSFGVVTSGTVNADLLLTDSVFGHLSVQKAWSSMFALGQPLNAWRNERAADRFARVCAEQGIPCRVVGRPAVTQPMGPQPRGSAWTILRDCANTEQGIVFEPRDCFGLGFRTRESMGSQSPAVTLDFAAANLRGDLRPVDDDVGFLNDVTGSMPDGTQFRAVLDDGSAKSVSEPEDGGMGRYAGQVPYSLNVADASELPSAVAFYLGRASVDEQRYRNVVADFGIPGAPVADMARLRPGDLIEITSVPGIYQSADIEQLVLGAVEAFGPGRSITWNGVPFSPYIPAEDATDSGNAILDTEGVPILDTEGIPILDTGA